MRAIFSLRRLPAFIDVAPAGEASAFLLTLAEHPAEKPALIEPVRVTVAGSAPVEFDLDSATFPAMKVLK